MERDIRKEFNAASEPVRRYLVSEIRSPSPRGDLSIEADLQNMRRFMSRRGRRRFDKLWSAQSEERKRAETRTGNMVWYSSTEQIRSALEACLKSLQDR